MKLVGNYRETWSAPDSERKLHAKRRSVSSWDPHPDGPRRDQIRRAAKSAFWAENPAHHTRRPGPVDTETYQARVKRPGGVTDHAPMPPPPREDLSRPYQSTRQRGGPPVRFGAVSDTNTWCVVRVGQDGTESAVSTFESLTEDAASLIAGTLRDTSTDEELDAGYNYLPRRRRQAGPSVKLDR